MQSTGNIAVKGWTESLSIPLVAGAIEAEKYCSELLFTCVEKKVCMNGTDMALVQSLRKSRKMPVVVHAGGVSSLVPEIKEARRLRPATFNSWNGFCTRGKVFLKRTHFINCFKLEQS